MGILRNFSTAFVFGFALTAHGAEVVVKIHAIDENGVGKPIGAVHFKDTGQGLMITPALRYLPPGPHGFHVHQNPDCGPGEQEGKTVPGLAAGGHYDPAAAGRHEGPHGQGHLGDLPVLEVGEAGIANTVTIAPRLKLADLRGRSIVIHAGGDSYSDSPQLMGGGGARIACGVVP